MKEFSLQKEHMVMKKEKMEMMKGCKLSFVNWQRVRHKFMMFKDPLKLPFY